MDGIHPVQRPRSPELRLLLACAGVLPAVEAHGMARDAAAEVGDWDRTLVLARQHGVFQLLHNLLSSMNPPPAPAEVIDRLRREAGENALAALDRAGELVRIVRSASDRGLDVLPLKGPLLAVQAYGDLGSRLSNDLDFLVTPEGLRDFHVVLEEFGYRPEPPLDDPDRLGWGKGILRFTNEVLYRSDDGRLVDVHLRIQPGIFPPIGGLADPSSHTVPAELGGVRMKTLSREAQVVYLCAHGAKHAWARLTWLADVARLAVAEPPLDRGRLEEFAGRNGSKMVSLGFLLSERLLGLPVVRPVADPALEALADRLEEGLLDPVPAPCSGPRVLRLLPLWGWRGRGHLLLELATRPQLSDLSAMPVPSRLAFLYRVTRPFRLAVARCLGGRSL